MVKIIIKSFDDVQSYIDALETRLAAIEAQLNSNKDNLEILAKNVQGEFPGGNRLK